MRGGALESGHDTHVTESTMVVANKTGSLEEVRVNAANTIVAVATKILPRYEECRPRVEAVFSHSCQTVLRVRSTCGYGVSVCLRCGDGSEAAL